MAIGTKDSIIALVIIPSQQPDSIPFALMLSSPQGPSPSGKRKPTVMLTQKQSFRMDNIVKLATTTEA